MRAVLEGGLFVFGFFFSVFGGFFFSVFFQFVFVFESERQSNEAGTL